MEKIERIRDMQAWSDEVRARGERIGFVPTMGYLHEGHLSLVRLAKERSDRIVVSIFVNPIQFGPQEDYNRYPRDLKRDLRVLRDLGVDAAFVPSVEEMYPEGFCTYVHVEGLTEGLCGAFRPGHFRGVTTVVTKLFLAVRPHVAAFGQKDAQQAFVIKRMVRDLNMDVEIVVGPTVREEDGLAMSSRNMYLSPDERRQATVLYRALMRAKAMVEAGERDPKAVVGAMGKIVEEAPSA
ncbi:MAG TPA: pantoate--beta-alanine ligase, partial [Candidatus Latescibacteria bacterium]|nr:pantoate--beta-alanine ligase [Candidatus Latescibacterota bacterium]